MASKLHFIIALMSFGFGWCMTDVHQRCIATFTEEFNSDNLLGTWHHIYHFSLLGGLLSTSECPTFIFTKPNSTELARYKEKYLRDDIPYSFDDNPVHEDRDDWRREGLLIGHKQAKFFIWNPSSVFITPDYDVMVYRPINDNYILFHDCKMRGNVLWLMSRNRNPPDAEVEAIISGHPELSQLRRQQFCALR